MSLLLMATVADARQITLDEAHAAAQDFFKHSSFEQLQTPRSIASQPSVSAHKSELTPYYIFNATNNKGFVIISGDDRSTKILGYSDTGSFNLSNVSPQLSYLLDRYSKHTASLLHSSTDNSWTNRKTMSSQNEGVLLETANWGQNSPYNDLCPTIDGVRCPSGCTATAMGIIMNYHQWPNRGRSYRKFLDNNSILHDINFENTEFNWDAVHDKTAPYSDATAKEIAKIVYSAAVANMTRFNTSESSASTLGIAECLNYYFKYGDDCQFIIKNKHSDSEWAQLIKDQIDNSLPVVYGGSGNTSHAFVCDGYDNEQRFHINWGWDGTNNGYYSLDLLNPADSDFSNDCWAIINIKPSVGEHSPSPVWLSQYGLSIDVENITPNQPFNTRTMEVTNNFLTGEEYDCEAALCLVDDKDKIIEIIKIIPMFFFDDNGNSIGTPHIRFTDCVVSTDVLPSYKLKIYSRNSASDKWQPIHGSLDCVSEIPVINNELRFTPLSWNLPSNVYLQTELEEYANLAYWDCSYFVRLYFPSDEMITVNINDQIMQPSHFMSDYCPYPRIGYYFDNALNIDVDFNNEYRNAIEFKVQTTPIADLKHLSINTFESNQIHKYFQNNNNPLLIGSIELSGFISEYDIIYLLTNYPNLKSIDLSKAVFCAYGGELKTELPTYLFNICLNLEKLSLPSNIETIPNGCITNCHRLKVLALPLSLKNVESLAFDKCYNLHHVLCPCEKIPNGLFEAVRNSHTSGDEYWYDPIYGGGYCTLYIDENFIDNYNDSNPNNKSIRVISNAITQPIEINDGMIKYSNFGNEVFIGCEHYMDVKSLNRLSLSGDISFRDKIDNLPVKYMFAHQFSDQADIDRLTFPNGLLRIGENAFLNCGVKIIDFPESMQTIDRYAFSNCNSLTDIFVSSYEPFFIHEEAFSEKSYNATLHVPAGTAEQYRQANVWNKFFNIVETGEAGIDTIIPDEITKQYTTIFSLQGNLIFQGELKEPYPLAPGIYIAVTNGSARKILVK